MLFNNLIDLILHRNIIHPEFCELLLTTELDNYKYILDKIISFFVCEYTNYFKNKCDNYPVIQTNFGISNYKLYCGNFDDNKFEVSSIMYKYFICIIFLDNNSVITFFENHKIYPICGDIVIFPSAWFFIYNINNKLTMHSNCNNKFIINNIVGFFT